MSTQTITESVCQDKLLRRYSVEEVGRHNSEGDAWLIIKGGVYNVTKFLAMHPGGKSILMEHLGKDATEIFTSSRIHSHSQKAKRILGNYCIGSTGDSYSIKKDEQEDLTGLVDMNKAILTQVLNMDPSKYQKWLHQANGTPQMRIFESNFFESLSRYPWWYIFFMWIPIICWTFYLALVNGNPLQVCISSFIFGFFVWGFIEYTFHRFLFHVETSSKAGNFYHLFAHGLHHLSPLDPTRLTFPPLFSIVVGIAFYNFFLRFYDIFPSIHAVFSGGALGYMLYDACHYYFHHGTINIAYLQWMKTRHLRHHYNDTGKNFGVTSPIFDTLFGTSD